MFKKMARTAQRLFCGAAAVGLNAVAVWAKYSDITVDGNSGAILIGGDDIVGSKTLRDLIPRYASVINFALAMLAITAFLIMLFQFMSLGKSGDNEFARKKAISGILVSGISLALFGSLALVVNIFGGLLK